MPKPPSRCDLHVGASVRIDVCECGLVVGVVSALVAWSLVTVEAAVLSQVSPFSP